MEALDRLHGCIVASFFSVAYYAIPGYFIGTTALIISDPTNLLHWGCTIPILLSAIVPPIGAKRLLQSWVFAPVPRYFRYREILETPHEELEQLFSTQPTLLCLQPHGVFSMVALCAAVTWSHTWWTPDTTPTAVADSVLKMPLLKHVVGMLGITNVSAEPLKKTLRSRDKKGVILYPGGTSELFLTSMKRERLFIKSRKGFIKIALQVGAAIVPGYLFGNTRVLTLLDWEWLRTFSRKTGLALTYFFGRFYLPIPIAYPCLSVIGKPIMLPLIPNPTQEDIDKWHAIYMSEVARIFNTYKVQAPTYENIELEME